MNNSRSSKLSLFLMELIIAIFFFSLAAAVCVRLFASAHKLSENTKDLENAVMWTQNLSEAFVSERGDLEKISELFPECYVSRPQNAASDKEGSIVLVFDGDWEITQTTLSNASYEIILTTAVKDAGEVYQDVNNYGTALSGRAVTGQIRAFDLRGMDDVLTDTTGRDDEAFHSLDVDVYIGEED